MMKPFRIKESAFVLTLILLIFLSFALPIQTLGREEPTSADLLTDDERAWLQANPQITLAFGDAGPPFTFIDEDGQAKGLFIDYVHLIEKKLGVKIELQGAGWSTALKLALDHEVDGILNAAALEKRKPFLSFTDVHHVRPLAVVASEKEPNIDSLEALCGRRVAVASNTSHSQHLKTHFPCIDVVEYKLGNQALTALITGEVDAVFGDVATYQEKMKKMGLTGYKPNRG